MADDARDVKSEAVDTALEGMKIEDGRDSNGVQDSSHDVKSEDVATPRDFKKSRSGTPAEKSTSKSPAGDHSASQSPKSEYDEEEDIGGDITLTVEPGKAPKLSRKSTLKVVARPPELYNDLPDSTSESLSVFQIIPECLYGSKSMGKSKSDDDDGPIDCDCSEERVQGRNLACGEESDCINRATKLECIDGDCPCGRGCQNQRFQRKQYANVSVIKTDKKGYGLRANVDLSENDFIFEYIGEVINEPTFRKRTILYDQEGIKHFYFMSLNKSEFIDATKKGNLGRFCNHSCNPNCYVDKWVVGSKLRMGIFAERNIKAGEELVFNYNVDRYGADPQPCYCGEANCSGYIGGKTQSGRATKLSHGTIEALGIDDGDGWDAATTKKPRKKKAGEDDEEYVNNVQPKGLDEEGVRKVMAALMQCKEKWIAVKLLDRIQRCDDDRVRNRVIQMHGYQILRSTLSTWKEDDNIILQVLDILYKFPRLTRNKISDSKIETAIQALVTREHEDVAFEAKRLIEEWSKLQVAYRIPRKKFDPSAAPVFERRNTDRVEETPKATSTPISATPTGPRGFPQRSAPFIPARPPRRPLSNALPTGWFTAADEKGDPYYYSKAGQTTWQRPTIPAAEPPPPPRAPNKSVQTAKTLQDIIDGITKAESTPQISTTSTPPSKSTPKEKQKPVEKWKLLSIEKQMKLYENTMLSHTKEAMQRFSKKLPKEDLKKFGKEVNKKLVSSDYKNHRVEDPTKMTKAQAEKAKHYVKQFFEKAVEKKKVIDRQKKEKEAKKAAMNGISSKPEISHKPAEPEPEVKDESEPEADADMDADLIILSPSTPVTVETPSFSENSDLKRKREEGEETPGNDSDSKRLKEGMSPPPPPPPPLAHAMPEGEGEDELEILDIEAVGEAEGESGHIQLEGELEHEHGHGTAEVAVRETKEEKERREQEEELMRENEEAMMMDMDGSLQTAEEIDKYLPFKNGVDKYSPPQENDLFGSAPPLLERKTETA